MAPIPPSPLPRLIQYYQTHHTSSGEYISPLPLLTQPGISLTHLILAAIHINEDPAALTLNDHPPSHPRFATLWAELRVLQASGVRVLGMLGGAAAGTYARLDCNDDDDDDDDDDASFERYYAPLRDLVRARGLDGLDLDVEEPMSLRGAVRLVDRLRADFGPGFVITFAPVAAALLDPRRNLSGFDYEALEVLRGRDIAWYNAQFYCGWGDAANPLMYRMILARGWPADKVVVGLLTSPDNGAGWVPWEGLSAVLLGLKAGGRGSFGGVMGWEYFNSLPGGPARPWEWARIMTRLLRDGQNAGVEDGATTQAVSAKTGVRTAPAATDVDGDTDHEKEIPVPADFEYWSDGIHDDS